MFDGNSDFSVTLSEALYRHLRFESRRLDVPLEWLVASLLLDTFEADELHSAPV